MKRKVREKEKYERMAELPRLGQQCQVSDCKLLDFLPFECSYCSKVYCLEHKFPDSHGCSKCNLSDLPPSSDDALPLLRKCSIVQCTAAGTEVVVCDKCGADVCLKHRHSWDHKCLEEEEKEEVSKTAEHVGKILEKASKPKPQGTAKPSAKVEKMAAKLALMKLKMKAVGDKNVLSENRVHLLAFLPKQSGQESKALYFYKALKVGKVIDKLSDNYNILNKNNRSDDKCLALFCHSDGHRLPVEKSLEELIKLEEIFDGSSVILEYTDSVTSCLDNLEDYHN
ncbi:AN1-type zinc finger protein 1 isoform X1 [Octopus bimaculoides]|nr:AN1-type zinc finger protein 1 isoform X1 [Octopus bimaculoides]